MKDIELSVLAYASGLNAMDLAFRHAQTQQHFATQYLSALRPPTSDEYELHLRSHMLEAQRLTSSYHRLGSIPWTIFILDPSRIENHMPHTHAAAIILPITSLINISLITLIHEQLHVFQRLYPLECHVFYNTHWGYKISPNGIQNQTARRSNPDINAIEYVDSTGKIIDNAYTSTAQRIGDIVDKRDHPHEIFAYRVSEDIVEGRVDAEPALRMLLNGA